MVDAGEAAVLLIWVRVAFGVNAVVALLERKVAPLLFCHNSANAVIFAVDPPTIEV